MISDCKDNDKNRTSCSPRLAIRTGLFDRRRPRPGRIAQDRDGRADQLSSKRSQTHLFSHHGAGLLTRRKRSQVEHDLGVGDLAVGGVGSFDFRHLACSYLFSLRFCS
jgi:hypothetical protein